MKRRSILLWIVLLLTFTGNSSTAQNPDDVYWENTISPSVTGLGGTVRAAAVFDGLLVVGGGFESAGEERVGHIAAWNGSTWLSLGTGLGGEYASVSALTVFDGKLIAGGSFSTAGGDPVGYIAAWDGSSWSPLGSGMNSYILALTVHDNKLIAAGYFTTAGDTQVNRVAAWDGSTWSSLSTGMNGNVYALTVYDGKLVAGGAFSSAGGALASCVALWNGSSWSRLSSEIGGGDNTPVVSALAVYDGKLIVGGGIATAGSDSVECIAAWNGSSWSRLGSGLGPASDWPRVYALTVYDGKLIAGGPFTEAGGVSANLVAAWDGSDWSAFGSGLGSDEASSGFFQEVTAFATYDNKLIAVGDFNTAGEVAVGKIAAWDGVSWLPLGSGTNGPVLALT
ncbi:MAG: hypothetical protein C4532_04120, partial [Candidatus Abyssobacteria bacterium SURF_17]